MRNASIAGATAILLVLVIAPLLRTQHSRGYMVLTQFRVPAFRVPRPQPCEDWSRPIVLRIDASGRWFINHDPVTREDVPLLLKEIFATRAEKVAYVLPDLNVDVQAVADLLDTATRSKANIEFLLLSDEGEIKRCLDAIEVLIPICRSSLGSY